MNRSDLPLKAPVGEPAASGPADPTVGVLIRFANSAATLPAVLAALRRQSLLPHAILGIDSGSMDGSRTLIEAEGGRVLCWTEAYEHSRVLNFGLRGLSTDLVLVLSSHTILEDTDTLARMVEAMREPQVACVSGKWDGDAFYSDSIDWKELGAKGLKFGSIYSNSMGMIRRSLWEREAFDEGLPTAEDYAWALSQLSKGWVCKRLHFGFSYRRSGVSRDREFARVTFRLAQRHGLGVSWLGVRLSATKLVTSWFTKRPEVPMHWARLLGWLETRVPFPRV